MDKYMHADKSDLLVSGLLLQYLLQESNTSDFLHMYKINSMYWVYKHFFNLKLEAIPESLKNMLLVMDTANIFHTSEGGESQLWKLTWDRIDTFLPHLKKELFKPKNSGDLIHYLFQFVTCFFVYCFHHVHFLLTCCIYHSITRVQNVLNYFIWWNINILYNLIPFSWQILYISEQKLLAVWFLSGSIFLSNMQKFTHWNKGTCTLHVHVFDQLKHVIVITHCRGDSCDKLSACS